MLNLLLVKHALPNLLTLGNLFFGCMAVVLAATDDIREIWVVTLICLAFDFLDGFAARLLKATSELGKQLDSLADLVSFGLVPSIIALRLLSGDTAAYGLHTVIIQWGIAENTLLGSSAFLIAIASAYRLARFNQQTSDPGYFVGLSAPANAVFWVFLPVWIEFHSDFSRIVPLMNNSYFYLLLIILSSALLVSNLKLWSFKKIPSTFKEGLPWIFLTVAIITGFAIYGWPIVPGLVVLYILLSLLYPPKPVA